MSNTPVSNDRPETPAAAPKHSPLESAQKIIGFLTILAGLGATAKNLGAQAPNILWGAGIVAVPLLAGWILRKSLFSLFRIMVLGLTCGALALAGLWVFIAINYGPPAEEITVGEWSQVETIAKANSARMLVPKVISYGQDKWFVKFIRNVDIAPSEVASLVSAKSSLSTSENNQIAQMEHSGYFYTRGSNTRRWHYLLNKRTDSHHRSLIKWLVFAFDGFGSHGGF